MLPVKFKVQERHNFYKTDDWFSNGHWAIRRSVVDAVPPLAKAFKFALHMPNGSYRAGYKSERTEEKVPDMSRVLPSGANYVPVSLSGKASIGFHEINQVELINSDGCLMAAFAPEYLPLLALGRVFAKDKCSPIVIRLPDDEIAAVIMPVRL